MLAASPTSVAKPRTSCCRASKSALNELSRRCIMLLAAFTVFVLRLRLVAVAIVPSTMGVGLRGGNVRREEGVPSRRLASQRMKEQCLTNGGLNGFRQERLGNEISRFRTLASEQPLR